MYIYLFRDVLFPTLRLRNKSNNCIATLFVGPNADEQNLSKKATVICQDEKRLHKGVLEYLKHEQCVHKSSSLFSLQEGLGDVRYFNLGVIILFLAGMLNNQRMVEASNKTRLKLTYKDETFSHWLQVNNVRSQQKLLVSGLLFSC